MKLTDIYGMAKLWSWLIFMVWLNYEADWYLWYGYIMKLTDIYGMAKLWS